jgi:hypothetical protein
MVQDLTRRLQKGNNLWWIAAISVVAFVFCVGAAMTLRYVSAPPLDALPLVPTYGYNTALPTIVRFQTSTLPVGAIPTATPVFVPPTLTPTPTPVSPFLSWIFPGFYATPTQLPYAPMPIQVAVVTLTPTVAFSPPSPIASNPNTCKNILYPARPGAQWTYYFNTPKRKGDMTMRVLSVTGQQATVDATELGTSATLRTYVQCDQDIILNFPLLSGQKIIGSLVNGNVNVDYVGGVLAPNEAAFIASNWALAWIVQYRIYGDGTLQYNGKSFSFSIAPSTINMTCQTLGAGNASFENIAVPAGSFNALKVICRGEGQANAVVNGTQVVGTITAQATQWFAPKIGLLRSQSDFTYLNVFGISIPLSSSDVSGYMELKNYAVGQ